MSRLQSHTSFLLSQRTSARRPLPRHDGGPVTAATRLRPNYDHWMELTVGNSRIALLSRAQVNELAALVQQHLEEMEIDDRGNPDRMHPCVKRLAGRYDIITST